MTIQSTTANTLQPRVVVASSDLFGMLRLQNELEEIGLRVIGCAADGDQAVRAARIMTPAMVILEAGPANLEIIDAARALHASRIAPTLILAEESHKTMLSRAAKSCAAAFLTRPLNRA